MPTDLNIETLATLHVSGGITSSVRALSDDIKSFCDKPNALNWADDLRDIGITFDTLSDTEREKLVRNVASAFGRVATEVSGVKRGARVVYRPDTGEVAVVFRKVAPRS